jgi:hypothetical protein
MVTATGFSVDPAALQKYAQQFLEAGGVWSSAAGMGVALPAGSGVGIAGLLAQCNLPPDAFGGWSPYSFGGFGWGSSQNTGLSSAYTSLWQFLSGVADTAQTTLDGWADGLYTVASNYQTQQSKQSASMSATGKNLESLNLS